MGQRPLELSQIDADVAALLDAALMESDLSLRRLSDESDVKLTRLGDVLRRGKSMTVGELNAISAALGLVGWKVLRQAEEGARVVPAAWDLAAQYQPGIDADEANL